MMRRGFLRSLATGCLAGACWLAAAAAQAAEWTVRPGESVAAAVKAANAGDTVRVERGFYAEHLQIDKPLQLVGVGRPTLSGSGKGDVIRIKSPDVSVEGFIVRDSGGAISFASPEAERLLGVAAADLVGQVAVEGAVDDLLGTEGEQRTVGQAAGGEDDQAAVGADGHVVDGPGVPVECAGLDGLLVPQPDGPVGAARQDQRAHRVDGAGLDAREPPPEPGQGLRLDRGRFTVSPTAPERPDVVVEASGPALLGVASGRMKLDAAQVCDPRKTRSIVDHHFLSYATGRKGQRRRSQPFRPVSRRSLLIKGLAFCSVHKPLQHDGSIANSVQSAGRDR